MRKRVVLHLILIALFISLLVGVAFAATGETSLLKYRGTTPLHFAWNGVNDELVAEVRTKSDVQAILSVLPKKTEIRVTCFHYARASDVYYKFRREPGVLISSLESINKRISGKNIAITTFYIKVDEVYNYRQYENERVYVNHTYYSGERRMSWQEKYWRDAQKRYQRRVFNRIERTAYIPLDEFFKRLDRETRRFVRKI